MSDSQAMGRKHAGSVWEVFVVFLRLGVTSFGGPVAHLGYFRDAFVARRGWLDDRAYADLVALCQFLPGPASSQVGMAVGLQRAGYPGLVAAWAGFTLPSAILMVGAAYGAAAFGGLAGSGWIPGLMAAAVAVVAQAVLGMASSLAPDARRATIAVAAMIVVLLVPSALTQVSVLVCAALVGLLWLRPEPDDHQPVETPAPVRRRTGVLSLALFAGLLVALPVAVATTGNAALSLFDSFYRAGSLVFGGGHVVLPLLQAETVEPGLITSDLFLAGYGVAQAVPGPLFTFAAYLGTFIAPGGIAGAAIALLAIFLPSALLVIGSLPFWDRLRQLPTARRALLGVNASVVGILAAALYNPVFIEGITGVPSLAIAAAAFVALAKWRAPAWAVVLCAGVLGALTL